METLTLLNRPEQLVTVLHVRWYYKIAFSLQGIQELAKWKHFKLLLIGQFILINNPTTVWYGLFFCRP